VKPLHKIVSAHIKKLQHNILLMNNAIDEDLIHEFRVEFKKIRAVVRLSGAFKIPSLVKDLYAAAGKVRELQLLKKQLLTSYTNDDLPQFYNRLSNEFEQAVSSLKEKTTLDYQKDLNELINNIPEKLTGRQIQKFIDKQSAALNELIQLPRKKDENIHDVRKIIKDLMYVFHALEQMEAEEFYLSSKEKQTLRNISEELGMFQDWCTLLSYLSLTKLRSLPEEEKQILKKIREIFLKTKQEAKSIILHQLNQNSFLGLKDI
jgi:CHAD domain-containing protein